MKRLFLNLIIIAFVSAMAGCSKPLSGTYVDEDKSEGNRITELEETIKRQEEEIEQLKFKKAVKNENKEIAEALRKRREGACSSVIVNEGVAKVYFCGVINATVFLNDPEDSARRELTLFLKKTGRKTGAIEYYFPNRREKIFSISGSLTSAEMKHHLEGGK